MNEICQLSWLSAKLEKVTLDIDRDLKLCNCSPYISSEKKVDYSYLTIEHESINYRVYVCKQCGSIKFIKENFS